MNVGDKMNWDWKPSNGYGAFYSVAAIVLKVTEKRVKIAIWNKRAKCIETTYVNPDNLSARTNHCELDEAYAAQKETQPA
jgi:hypothetical protein